MTDHLDVKARLSLENDLSPEMRRVVEDIKRFEKNADRLKKSFQFPLKGSILDSKVLGEVQKELGQTGKKFNRLTKDQMAWAREQKRIGQLTTDTWLDIRNHIDDTVKAFQNATGKKKKELAKQLKEDVGYARAFRYLYQGEHERYERAVDQHHRALNRLDLMKQKRADAVARAQKRADDKAAKDQAREAKRAEREAKRAADEAAKEVRRQNRIRERMEREHHENMVRARRVAIRGVSRAANAVGNLGGRGLGLRTALGTGGAALAVRSAVRASTTVDTEKAYAQIFQGMTAEQADKLYRQWAIPTGAKMGIRPSELMRSTNEAVQQGVPEDLAPKYAELVTKAAKQLRMPTAQLTESFGPMMAQLRGQGRLKTTDDAEKFINLAVTMANQSAATRESVISAMRTGFGATDLMGMDDAHGMALMTTLIEGGSQGQQAARGVGHMAQRLANLPLHAKDVRRKHERSAEDQLFLKAPEKLGYGSFEEISRRFKQNPNQAPFEFLQRFNRIKDVQERSNLFFALMGQDFARFELNVVKMSESVTRNIELANKAMGEKPGDNALSKGFDIWLTTWEAIQERISAMWEPIISDLGEGFKDFADEFMKVFGDFSQNLTNGNLKNYVRQFFLGLINGFGFGSLKEMLEYLMPKNGFSADSFYKFGKGIAEGLKAIWKVVEPIFNTLKGWSPDQSSAETLGKLVGAITGLSLALTAISPVLSVMASITSWVMNMATAYMLWKGIKGAPAAAAAGGAATPGGTAAAAAEGGIFSRLAGKIGLRGAGWLGFLLMGDGRPDNSADDTDALIKLYNEERLKNIAKDPGAREIQRQMKQNGLPTVRGLAPELNPHPYTDGSIGYLKKKASYEGPTDFSGRRRMTSSIDDLAKQMEKFGGTVERASFISSTGGAFSGFGTGYRGGGGASGGSVTSSVPTSLTPGGGGAYSLFGSTPGGSIPDFGVGAGGIIRRGRVGGGGSGGGAGAGVPAGGPADMSVGEGLSGNSYLAARRARFAEEIKNDPTLRRDLAAMQHTEGASGGGTIESLMNRADMEGKTLRQMLGWNADGTRANGPHFYGPILRDPRTGEFRKGIATVSGNKALFKKYDDMTNAALAGSHRIGGFTDQGLPTDPNGSVTRKRRGQVPLPMMTYGGNEFTEWGGTAKARKYRLMIEKGIAGSGDSPVGSVPTGADAVRNVPAPQSAPMRGGWGGGSGGNVAIHINGNSHDPEALATLIQRRVDESMNWRTHDSESEYT